MADYKYVTYELLDEGHHRPIMPQPARSAQRASTAALLVDLGDAFLERGGRRQQWRVVILGGHGPMSLGPRSWLEGHDERVPPARISIDLPGERCERANALEKLWLKWLQVSDYFFENTAPVAAICASHRRLRDGDVLRQQR